MDDEKKAVGAELDEADLDAVAGGSIDVEYNPDSVYIITEYGHARVEAAWPAASVSCTYYRALDPAGPPICGNCSWFRHGPRCDYCLNIEHKVEWAKEIWYGMLGSSLTTYGYQ